MSTSKTLSQETGREQEFFDKTECCEVNDRNDKNQTQGGEYFKDSKIIKKQLNVSNQYPKPFSIRLFRIQDNYQKGDLNNETIYKPNLENKLSQNHYLIRKIKSQQEQSSFRLQNKKFENIKLAILFFTFFILGLVVESLKLI